MTINGEYIKMLRKKFSYSQEELAKKLSLSLRTIQNWEGGGVIPKTKHAMLRELISEKIEGEFIESSDEETVTSKAGMQFIPNQGGTYTMITPHITEYGYGGYMAGFSDEKYLGEMPSFSVVVNEVHRGIYRSITMRGESMDDGSRESIVDGDVLTGRYIQRHLWENSALHFKKHRFFIIHSIDGILVKEIIAHDVEGKKIMIHSLNPDKEAYPDEWIDLNRVKELFNVTHRSTKM